MPRFCAVIPCYNHHDVIADIVRTLLEYVEHVIIVDDGSRIQTREVLDNIASQYQGMLSLRRHVTNKGKGVAVRSGMLLAGEMGFSHALQVDADGQHDLTTVPLLIEHARTFPQAIVTAIPVYDETVNRTRFLTRYITHFWVWVETLSFSIKDSMCGFRIYPVAKFLAVTDRHLASHMDFDTDAMVRMYWAGCDVISVPSRVRYIKDGLSNFRLLRDNLRISWMHTRLVLGMLLRIPRLLRRKIAANPQYDQHWSQQKEKGTYLGIRILFNIYRWFGRGIFSMAMHPVVFFFFILSPEKRQASRNYLEMYNAFVSNPQKVRWYHCYAHFIAFGYSAIDKLSAWLEKDLPVSGFYGEEHYQQLEQQGKGAVFIGSHLGNLEYCRSLSRSKTKKTINAVVFTEHAENFTRALKRVNPAYDVNLVQVSSFGVDTAIKFREKVEAGEILVIVGDRTSPYAHDRNLRARFMGKDALFPQGPFVLASLMDCPIFLLFCIKEQGGYNIYLEPFRENAKLPRSERESALSALIQDYARRLEYYCKKSPLQWFNFFDFWVNEDASSTSRKQ